MYLSGIARAKSEQASAATVSAVKPIYCPTTTAERLRAGLRRSQVGRKYRRFGRCEGDHGHGGCFEHDQMLEVDLGGKRHCRRDCALIDMKKMPLRASRDGMSTGHCRVIDP